MKHTLKFLYKVLLVAIVSATVFALPAATAAIVWLDKSIYTAALHSPGYCAVMTILSIVMTCVYVDYMITKSKSNADHSK